MTLIRPMKEAQEIMEVLSNYGNGDQIRFFNAILKQNGNYQPECKRVFNHTASMIGPACGLTKKETDDFNKWLNTFEYKEMVISEIVEKLYNNDDMNINALIAFVIILQKLDPQDYNELLGG